MEEIRQSLVQNATVEAADSNPSHVVGVGDEHA